MDADGGGVRSLAGGAGELRGVSWGGWRGWEGMNEWMDGWEGYGRWQHCGRGRRSDGQSIGGEGMEQDSKQRDGRGNFIDRYVVLLLKTPIRSLSVSCFFRSLLPFPSQLY